jgi:hypothetical protein
MIPKYALKITPDSQSSSYSMFVISIFRDHRFFLTRCFDLTLVHADGASVSPTLLLLGRSLSALSRAVLR